jgi:hypothetical protein
MLGFLLTTLIFIGVLVGLTKLQDYQKVKENWQEYRCQPDVMIMADFYGHSSSDNLEYCLKNGFDTRAAQSVKPFYTYLALFVNTLTTMLANLNSLRMTFATIVGTVTQVFREFTLRIQALLARIQYTSYRIKFLMGRVFGIMYSVVFMGMSGIKAGQNFSNTFLFKFLDTFCFDPDTPIHIEEKGWIPIREAKIGDRFVKDGSRITAVFQFAADGQPMVRLPGPVLVSTNHYLLHPTTQTWVQARDHPDAQPAEDWAGGNERPLICLNTDSHRFPLGDYVFADYDETAEGDVQAMHDVLQMLNGSHAKNIKTSCSDMAVSPKTQIRLANGHSAPASHIKLGTELSHGKVVGVVLKEVPAACYWKGDYFAPGTTIWHPEKLQWVRVETVAEPMVFRTPFPFTSFVISPSAVLETKAGTVFRDYVEIHDPRLEASYSEALLREGGPHLIPELRTEC